MRQVVANIAEYSSTKHCCCNGRIPVENEMCKLPERGCEGEKQGRGHYQSQLVHWQVVMDAVEKKVEGNGNTIVGEEAVSA